jgi:hypothetical protein
MPSPVDEEGSSLGESETCRQIDGRGGLADSALLIDNRKHPGHE